MIDDNGFADNNQNLLTATTLSARVNHEGWTQAQALGGRSPVSQASGLSSTHASVTLSWNPMIAISATVTSYNVYRGTFSGGQNFSSPLATGLTSPTFTDITVAPQTTYYYIMKPVIGNLELATTSEDTEIRIPVPPTNMALVHRWIANLEMCSHLMGRTIDRNNNYRCPYIGPINNGGYYDLGQHQFWDVVQAGCNYTPPNSTPTLSCGDSTNGCLQTTGASPSFSAANYDGQVVYDRNNGNCFVASSSAWVQVNSANASQMQKLYSLAPGLPPLVNIDQPHSYLACQQMSIPSVGLKRLPKHSEQIIASAWPVTMSDGLISIIENGSSLPTTGYCNSNYGNGLTYDNGTSPVDPETLPGTNGGSVRSVRTASNSTQNCISLHGIQDYTGNVWEWSTDQLATCSSGSHTCQAGGVSTIDPSNTDWYFNSGALEINFDGTIGPGGGSSNVTEWNFVDQSYSATDFLVPLGLPLVESVLSSYDPLPIGSGTGQFNPNLFHGNRFYLYTDNGSPRGAFGGGGWYDGSNAGRFALSLNYGPSSTYNVIGFRCMAPVN